jgi:hypothetical protein
LINRDSFTVNFYQTTAKETVKSIDRIEPVADFHASPFVDFVNRMFWEPEHKQAVEVRVGIDKIGGTTLRVASMRPPANRVIAALGATLVIRPFSIKTEWLCRSPGALSAHRTVPFSRSNEFDTG